MYLVCVQYLDSLNSVQAPTWALSRLWVGRGQKALVLGVMNLTSRLGGQLADHDTHPAYILRCVRLA